MASQTSLESLWNFLTQKKGPFHYATYIGSAALAAAFAYHYCTHVALPPEVHCSPSEFNQRLLQQCSVLHETYFPTFWACGPHVSTVVGDQLRVLPELTFRRQIMDTEDGGIVALDWIDRASFTPTTPTVIVLHGLNGGSHSTYVRMMCQKLLEMNMRPVAVNNRGHNDTELKTPVIVSGAYTDDLKLMLQHIRQQLPLSPLFAIGYSMGGNILTKYLGTEGAKTPLAAAVAISNPLDFQGCTRVLEKGFGVVYNKLLTNGLRATYTRHRRLFATHAHIDEGQLLKSQYLREFDEQFTRRVWGYKSVDDYYDDASSVRYLNGVAVPLMILNARDDPFIDPTALVTAAEHAKANPNVIVAVTEAGGHMGFPEKVLPVGQVYNYADRAAAQFIKSVCVLKDIPIPIA